MDAASKKRKTDDNDVAAFSTDTPTLTPEIAREILEPLSKDQLLEILQTAVVNHRDVLDAVRPIASADPSKRKLFVRGLGWDTTTDKLRTVFSLFGDLDEAIVINDKSTGKSKGYGFVTFRHIDAALLALREPSKRIDGRMTVTQLAAANAAANGVAADVSMRKIFVGNVPFEISSERLLDHFSMFGEIEEGPLGFDNQSGKPRGFAFLVFKTEEGAKASLVDSMKIIDGHQVTCKLAVDGKKGKTGGPNLGVQAPTEEFKPPPGSMPVNSNYGLPGGGFSSYGGFAGGPPAMTHQNPHLNSSIGGQGFGNQGFSSLGNAGGGGGGGGYGGGLGGTTYGGSQYGGSGSGEYGGLNSGGSSLYRLPQSSSGLPSGGYPNSGNYGLSSSAFPSQLHQPPPGPRVPPGGMYQGMPPYF